MQNKIATSHSNTLEVSVPKQLNVDRQEWSINRRWKVSMSYKADIFLTEEEKDYFINQISKGKKIIRVGEMILTNKFICIVPVGQIYKNINEINKDTRTEEEKKKALDRLNEIRDEFE